MEPLRVGVVGVGRLGQHHARNYYENPRCKLVGVADIDREQSRRIAKSFKCKSYTDYHDLIGQVDAVSVVVPTISHFEVGTAFLEAGVHCLVEKPICNTIKDASALVDLAHNRNLILQVGHIEHFNVAVQKMKQLLTMPRFIECHRLGPYDPRVKDIGVVLDLMIHDIDIILRIVNSPIVSIEAVGVSILSEKEDIANVRIRFEKGCIANLTVSRVTPKPMRKLRIWQEDMYISLDYRKQQMEIHRREKVERPRAGEPPWKIVASHTRLKREEPLKLELDNFLQCIQEGQTPATTGEQAMTALQVVIKIMEIIRETCGALNPQWFASPLEAQGPITPSSGSIDSGQGRF
jgi:predicted dehydrogenase